jgi:transcriptional regulator with XRE-family HTH domain
MLNYQETLGPALRLLRGRRHLKQMEVAAKARITKAMLSSYETGAAIPSLQSLTSILSALGTDFREFQEALHAVTPGGPPGGGDSNEQSQPQPQRGEVDAALLPEILVRQLGETQALLERIATAIESLAPKNPGLGLPFVPPRP